MGKEKRPAPSGGSTKAKKARKVKDETDASTAAEKEAAVAAFLAFKAAQPPPGKKKRTPREDKERDEAKSEYEANKTVALECTKWWPGESAYRTWVKIAGKTVDVYTHSLEAAREASRLAAAVKVFHSKETKRARKEAKFDELAPKREKDKAKNGDNSAMERRVLVQLRNLLAAEGVAFHICPDGCLADALYRTADMPDKQWLMLQLKTTAKEFDRKYYKKKRGRTYTKRGYEFQDVKGYGDMLVACVCEGDGMTWVLPGSTLDAGKSTSLEITRSTKSGNVRPTPCGKVMPTTLAGLVARLCAECAKAEAENATALPTVTLDAAEAMLGKSHAVEYAGVQAYIRHVLGGALPWDGTPDSLIYRKTHSGKVFRYPDEQNGKTDFIVYDGAVVNRLQFKTATKLSGHAGWHVVLATAAGKDTDGKKLYANNSKHGDNTHYVMCVPPASTNGIPGEVHFWIVDEATMLAHNLVGPGALQAFYVHMPDELQMDRGGVANRESIYEWTKDFHTMIKIT